MNISDKVQFSSISNELMIKRQWFEKRSEDDYYISVTISNEGELKEVPMLTSTSKSCTDCDAKTEIIVCVKPK